MTSRAVILHESRSIWLFVPKAGSCSIRIVLCGALGIPLVKGRGNPAKMGLSSRTPLPWVTEAEMAKHPDYWRWAFVREPHARLLSAYCSPTIRNRRQFAAAGIAAGCRWAEFVEAVCAWPADAMDITVAPQTRIVKAADFVGQIERPEDWQAVADRLGFPALPLPRANANHHVPAREVYSPAQWAAVAEKYRDDIERFGYG